MNYLQLRLLRDKLLKKTIRNADEEQLLRELIALGDLLNTMQNSLSMRGGVCPTGGKNEYW